MHTLKRSLLAPLTLALVAGCTAQVGGEDTASSSGSALSGSSIASIALANVGKQACSRNSAGGYDFDSSCTGNGGSPEFWCADFVRWVWAEAGANTDGLDAAAGSFYVYGINNHTLHSSPVVGDAVVFDYSGGGVADHVAIVTEVNANGTIETVSGDWGGDNGSEATFASTSHVVFNSPAYGDSVGNTPGIMGMTISGYISPAGTGGSPPPNSGTCADGPGYCTATLQCENGYWVPRATDPAACTSGPGAGGGDSNYCSEGGGYCTATTQCDNHDWVPRSSDPAACTSGPGASGGSNYCSEGDGYCTGTSQCDNHQWVPRSSDPDACTSGPGTTSSNYCSEGDGYCTATLQCDNHGWVPRSSDPAACTSGPGA